MEPDLWKRVDDRIATKQPSRYDNAVEVLTELQHLAQRTGAAGRHARKLTMIERLQKAGF